MNETKYTINDATRGYKVDSRYLSGLVKRLDIFLEDLGQSGEIHGGTNFYKYTQLSMSFSPAAPEDQSGFPVKFGEWKCGSQTFKLYIDPSIDPDTFILK